MCKDFKYVNGREVTFIGYDRERHLCIIGYNHSVPYSFQTVYYENIEPELFDEVVHSNHIAAKAKELFKDKPFKS